MKTTNIYGTLAAIALATLPLSSCSKKDMSTGGGGITPPEPLPTQFDYATTQDKAITLDVIDLAGNSLPGITVSTYLENPVSPVDGTLLEGFTPIHRGITDFGGKLEIFANIPTYIDSLYFIVHSTGFANPIGEPLQSNAQMFVTLAPAGYATASGAPTVGAQYAANMDHYNPALLYGNVYQLGDWNVLGRPHYLTPKKDIITASMRDNVSGAVPEYYSVTKTHPEYFNDPTKANINIIEDAEVWITFVSEGAGYTSTMGYFTYPTNNPPRSAADIDRRTVVLPNCSFAGSGGGLVEGDKVQLLYYDKSKGDYTVRFPAGVSIGWFILSNGYQGGKVTNGLWSMYSFKDFNPGSYQQTLVLNDTDNKVMYITFEDISIASGGSDKDFNDVVFYATSTPYSAISQEGVPTVKKPVDKDKDGVPDVYDEYPDDPALAFNSYYPAKDVYGTVTYEDLWPATGDYDFNDLVVDLNIHQTLNAANKVVSMDPSFRLRAVGASYHNAFALGLNCPPSAIGSVSGQRLTKAVFNMTASGTESGVPTTVIPVFSNAYDLFGNRPYTNTYPNQPKMTPVDVNLKVIFTSPVDQSTLGTAPFDPFMVVDGDRSREVHLVNKRPTAKANANLLGTIADASNPAKGVYYISKDGHPWAISTPVSLAYPVEKARIGAAHKMFDPWAKSMGTQYKDWYLNKANYRDNSLIYNK